MSDEQLDELIQWLPAKIAEHEILDLVAQAEERFPKVHPDSLSRAIGRLYGIPI